MKKLSNGDTDIRRVLMFFISLIAFVLMIILIINTINNSSDMAIYLVLFLELLGMLFITLSVDFGLNLKNIYVKKDLIIVKGFFKSEKIKLSDIKSVNSYYLMANLGLGRYLIPFTIRFEYKTAFGKKIYVIPTQLNEKNKISITMDIQEYLTHLVIQHKL